jgi:hypothetical protein
MTPAEVAAVMGGLPNADKDSLHLTDEGWEVDSDSFETNASFVGPFIVGGISNVGAWSNGSVNILIAYRDGKVIWKSRHVYQPWWKIKAREWLAWLRGLVGW